MLETTNDPRLAAPDANAHARGAKLGRETWTAWLMSTPALLGLLVFVVLPFVMAAVFSLTDQRLMSPNPTEFVGLRNYERLLAVTVVKIEPVRDETGRIIPGDDGQPSYPRLRSLERDGGGLRGYKEMTSVDVSGARYMLVAKDPVFWRSLANIVLFALLVVPLQCGLALATALLINRKLRGITFFRAAFFSPVVISMVVISIVWSFLYDRQFGLINQMLSAMSFGHIQPIDWLGNPHVAMLAIVIMSAWQGMGFQMVIFLAGLQGIPGELYEAACLDGANAWQRFVNVTLPGLRNTLVFILTATTMQAFSLFTQIDVMTQGGPDNSTVTVMYHAVNSGFREQDIAYGSTITVVFFLFILGFAFVQRRLIAGKQR
ncbi:carbohydrate ABC transporter permease [Burkholderia guangdongensis]|uniref:carbohydrate ABC transporter permease n=1 Tax=Burkholderia guangdongensis TaxID=1792500 RepID=UPI001C5364B6|nr:sugar ABC transporter permease [Burkholderia guangdongensis]